MGYKGFQLPSHCQEILENTQIYTYSHVSSQFYM